MEGGFYWVKFDIGDDWVTAWLCDMDKLFRGYVKEIPVTQVIERMEEIGPRIYPPN